MKRILAIWLPNWSIQRLSSDKPELAGQAVILHSPSRRGQAVAACSGAAYELGVRIGMPVAEATAILSQYSKYSNLVHDAPADRRGLEQLAQWCHRFAPTVGLEESDSQETILLEATHLAPLYGGERALVGQVARGLERHGLEARVALAGSIGAAWAMTHYGEESRETSRATAGSSSSGRRVPASALLDEPAGAHNSTFIVRRGRERTALAPLPVAALRLPEETLETLQSLAINRIGDLAALPRDQLRSRLGPHVLVRLDQALGAAREVTVPVAPPEEFAVEQLFDFPLSRQDAIHHVVEQLLERLAWLLAARCTGALRLACRFECEDAAAVEVEVGLFQPSANPRHWLELVDLEMEARVRLPGTAVAISIRVQRHAPLAERQGVLFEAERSLGSSWQLAALVDRLAGRLGREAVVRCRLRSDAQSELAYRETPLVDGRLGQRSPLAATRQRSATAAEDMLLAPLDRPLCLLKEPAAVETVALVPDGPPISFRRGGRRYTIARQWGPERIETGWWRGQSARRDYYRVETSEGRRYWLFRRRRDGRWFLHGVYE